MRQTTMAKEATIERKWYVVDATGLTLCSYHQCRKSSNDR